MFKFYEPCSPHLPWNMILKVISSLNILWFSGNFHHCQPTIIVVNYSKHRVDSKKTWILLQATVNKSINRRNESYYIKKKGDELYHHLFLFLFIAISDNVFKRLKEKNGFWLITALYRQTLPFKYFSLFTSCIPYSKYALPYETKHLPF